MRYLKEEIRTANLINTFHKTHYSVSSEKKSTFLLGSYFIVKNKKNAHAETVLIPHFGISRKRRGGMTCYTFQRKTVHCYTSCGAMVR